MEAVVLAGGMGTRLKERVADRPKPMALVAGRPFLDFVLRSLEQSGVRRVILATGFLAEVVSSHYGRRWRGLELEYSVETEALGTGGAFRQAMDLVRGSRFWALNGDSLLACDLSKMIAKHESVSAELTIALRHVPDAGRFGAVETAGDGRVSGFQEKGQGKGPAYINGGVYLCEKRALQPFASGRKFSFEKEILEAKVRDYRIYGVPTDGFFIDIGIPADYDRAQTEPFLKELIS